MKIKANFSYALNYFGEADCRIEKLVEASPEDFKELQISLQDNSLLLEHKDCMYEQDGVHHCLLVLERAGYDGVLAEAKGPGYPFYAAYITGMRDILNGGLTSIQYPSLQGNRPLTAADLDVQERIGVEDERINFCLDVLADEKSVFGRQLSSEAEDSYVQAYTSYMLDSGRVDDTLDIVVRSPGGDEWFSCILTDEARESLRQKLDTFCVNTYAERLPSPPVQDGPAPPQMGPTM